MLRVNMIELLEYIQEQARVSLFKKEEQRASIYLEIGEYILNKLGNGS
jgi:hypothetical protein